MTCSIGVEGNNVTTQTEDSDYCFTVSIRAMRMLYTITDAALAMIRTDLEAVAILLSYEELGDGGRVVLTWSDALDIQFGKVFQSTKAPHPQVRRLLQRVLLHELGTAVRANSKAA